MMTIKQFFLLKLAEECTEVAKRCSKQMQFGKEESQAQGPSETKIPETNAQRLRAEINDLLVNVRILETMLEIPEVNPEDWDLIFQAKWDKLVKYLKYSQDLGMVETGDAYLAYHPYARYPKTAEGA